MSREEVRQIPLVVGKSRRGWTNLRRESGEDQNTETMDRELRFIDHRNEYAGFNFGECGGEFD